MRCRRLLGVLLAALTSATAAFAQPEPAATLGRPAAALGRPRPMPADADLPPAAAPIRPANFEPEPTPAERIIGPTFEAPPFSPPDDSRPRPSYASPGEDFLSGRPAAAKRPDDDRCMHTTNFGEKLRQRFDEWMQPGKISSATSAAGSRATTPSTTSPRP